MLNQNEFRFVLSGGGTGGHIFPAIAIAQALLKINPQAKILFVGALGKMEMERVPAQGFEIIGIPISGFQRRISIKNIKLPFLLLYSLWKCRNILQHFKPHAAIGTGGYASGPLLFVASLKNIPIYIQEQNAFPGLTNKILAKRAYRIYTGFSGMDNFFKADKILHAGNPVRQELEHCMVSKPEAYAHFNFNPQLKTLLVLGGSLGAQPINAAIEQGYKTLLEHNIQIIWQTGSRHFDALKTKVTSHVQLHLQPFLTRMDYAYCIADLVISRAGASSLSELICLLKPSVLIPSPYVAEDHQTKNAQALADVGAAVLMPESHVSVRLLSTILDVMQNDAQREAFRTALHPLQHPDAAKVIAQDIFKTLQTST